MISLREVNYMFNNYSYYEPELMKWKYNVGRLLGESSYGASDYRGKGKDFFIGIAKTYNMKPKQVGGLTEPSHTAVNVMLRDYNLKDFALKIIEYSYKEGLVDGVFTVTNKYELNEYLTKKFLYNELNINVLEEVVDIMGWDNRIVIGDSLNFYETIKPLKKMEATKNIKAVERVGTFYSFEVWRD